MSTEPAAPAAAPENPDLRVVDGEQQHRIVTTQGIMLLARALVCRPGWHKGTKEFARARKLGKALPKLTPPDKATEEWDAQPIEVWLPERLRTHLAKCMSFFIEEGLLSGAPDDDAIEPFLIRIGLNLKDD